MNMPVARNPWSVTDVPSAERSHAFFPVRPRDPAVRPLPFPYRGALAISNDAEFLSPEFFEVLMRFLNTQDDTPLGRGLGLEITSSVFFYSAPDYNFSYYAGANFDAPRTPFADRIDDYLRSGWIDTIHAYGDFDGRGGCTRAHAAAVYHALAETGVVLEVFSNHGSADNVQNVGADAAYHRGDDPKHAAYHADLLETHGVRYVWTDSLVMPLPEVGGRRARLRRWLCPPDAPELLTPCRLQDGRSVLGFRRLRGTGSNAPNLSSLATQLGQIDWGRMYESWSATVVYQHLGVLCRVNGVCTAATIDAVTAQSELYLGGFMRLQAERNIGHLWVCGCADLLRYLEMVRDVTIRSGSDASSFVVEFPRAVTEPEKFFSGLTFAMTSEENVRVTYAGRELTAVRNPVQSGEPMRSITIERRRAPNIW